VYRFTFDLGKRPGVRVEGSAILATLLHCRTHGFRHFRAVPCQLFQEGAGEKHEDAAVPTVVALGQETLGCGEIGLLNESLDLETALKRRAAPDVAEACFRCGRLDAERYEPVLRCQLRRSRSRSRKALGVRDMVIAWTDQHDRIGWQTMGCQGDSRRGVLRHRLHYHFRLRERRRLRLDMAALSDAGHDH